VKELQRRRDSVLDRAALQPGDVVLDVGCGDGLIGFGAIDRVGPEGRVIFSDISSNLVERCRAMAENFASPSIGGLNSNFPFHSEGEQGGGSLLDRCSFVVNAADDLLDISDGSVDVVTTRSVLIYVDRKDRAFAEFFRVLRPGGHISIGEPINRFSSPEPRGRFLGYDVTSVVDIADKLEAFFDREERPKIDAMMDFDERDLIAIAERTGFVDIHLDLQVDIKAPRTEDWNRFVRSAGNPLSPTLEEAMKASLTPTEHDRFTAHLKPLVESGTGTQRRAFAYVSAKRPAR
jgi:ubiquinone/menaquinone biosynthesis C-methylase UbiE